MNTKIRARQGPYSTALYRLAIAQARVCSRFPVEKLKAYSQAQSVLLRVGLNFGRQAGPFLRAAAA